jgi:inhibitor of KinA sporulation pathway (predicted exonuclease)
MLPAMFREYSYTPLANHFGSITGLIGTSSPAQALQYTGLTWEGAQDRAISNAQNCSRLVPYMIGYIRVEGAGQTA